LISWIMAGIITNKPGFSNGKMAFSNKGSNSTQNGKNISRKVAKLAKKG